MNVTTNKRKNRNLITTTIELSEEEVANFTYTLGCLNKLSLAGEIGSTYRHLKKETVERASNWQYLLFSELDKIRKMIIQDGGLDNE